MAVPLSREEFRVDLNTFLKSEIRIVFEDVLSAKLDAIGLSHSKYNIPGNEKGHHRDQSSWSHSFHDLLQSSSVHSLVDPETKVEPSSPSCSPRSPVEKLAVKGTCNFASRKSMLRTSPGSPRRKQTVKQSVRITLEPETVLRPETDSRTLSSAIQSAPEPVLGGDYLALTDKNSDMTKNSSISRSNRYKSQRSTDTSSCLRHFNTISGAMVLLNVLCVGFDTDHRLTHKGKSPRFFETLEICFCVFFVGELAIRIGCLGSDFFFGHGKYWNWFDVAIVSMQVFEQVLRAAHVFDASTSNISQLRVLRMLRLIRVIRLIRVFHMFDELRQILDSMINSCTVLMWSMAVLLLQIYLFSVLFLQCILSTDHMEEFHQRDQLQHYFGSLSRTIFTMFECVAGGVNWDDVVSPLMSEVSPYLGIVFSVYVCSSVFAIMNMLTGVFCDRAMTSIREDRENIVATNIYDHFLCTDDDPGFIISREAFDDMMQCGVMQTYLKDLGITNNEIDGVFDLIDESGQGVLTLTDAADGCLRLRGEAKALDIAIIMRQLGLLRNDMSRLLARLSSVKLTNEREVNNQKKTSSGS